MSGDAPRIAAAIPAFDREGTVGRAVRSALEQRRPPVEVVVVDDGSSDGTADAVRALGGDVRLVQQANAGGAAARNRGAREARAEWVAFLDSDDYWTPGHLEAVAAAIEATDGRADFYFADLRRTAEEGGLRQWEQARFAIEGEWQLAEDGAAWIARPRMPMMLQGTVFHRERFLAKGGLWDDLRRRHDTHGFLVHGVGHPVCAVAHVGTVMTADDETGGRLSDAMTFRSRRYLGYSTMLWEDVLARLEELAPRRRALLRHRLALARLRLARLELRERRPVAGLAQLARALAAHPATVARKLAGSKRDEWALFPDL